jgi:hypothetical protein
MDATTLADFDLLRDSRQDIRQQPWTQPSRREAMNLYFGMKRAKEEISRLNIEIRRLVTFMIDDHQDFHRAISTNIIIDPALAQELSYQWEYRHQIHSQIASRLRQTSRLNGFTGTLLPGTREGRELVYTEGGLPKWATDIFGFVETYDEVDGIENPEDATEHDEVLPNSDLVLQLLENISVQDTVDNSS